MSLYRDILTESAPYTSDKFKKIMNDKKVYERLSRQARIQGESHSSKYYAEKILDVYYTALGGRNEEGSSKEKKTFFSKLKNVVKKGFNGK